MRRHVTCVSRYFIASLDIFVFAHLCLRLRVCLTVFFIFIYFTLCVLPLLQTKAGEQRLSLMRSFLHAP